MSLTLAEIDHVLANLAPVSVAELDAAGLAVGDVRKVLRTVEGHALYRNGKPILLYGCSRFATGMELYNLGTAEYYATPLRSLRESRAALTGLRAAHAGLPFYAHTYSTHPQARRWVELLGLRPVSERGGVLLSFIGPFV